MTKPIYLDDCHHGEQHFVGSCMAVPHCHLVDVYVEPPRTLLDGTALVCLRYGDGPEYYSMVSGAEGARGDYGDAVGDLVDEGIQRLQKGLKNV